VLTAIHDITRFRVSRARVAAAVLAAFGVIACACLTPNSPPTLSGNPYVARSALQAEPASKLAMPGAERLRDVSAERFNTVDGPQPAFTGALWGSQEDFTRVYDYYRLQLPPLGWTADRDAILASGEYLGKLWCKPTMLFRLAFLDPKVAERIGIQGASRFAVIFDVRLQSATGQCPQR
jgi:hypothetical protein